MLVMVLNEIQTSDVPMMTTGWYDKSVVAREPLDWHSSRDRHKLDTPANISSKISIKKLDYIKHQKGSVFS